MTTSFKYAIISVEKIKKGGKGSIITCWHCSYEFVYEFEEVEDE